MRDRTEMQDEQVAYLSRVVDNNDEFDAVRSEVYGDTANRGISTCQEYDRKRRMFAQDIEYREETLRRVQRQHPPNRWGMEQAEAQLRESRKRYDGYVQSGKFDTEGDTNDRDGN